MVIKTENLKKNPFDEAEKANPFDIAQKQGELVAIRRPEGTRGVFDNPNKQLDQLLGDGNLDDFLPMDVKYDFGRIIKMTKEPSETEGKIKLSLLYKSIADISPRISFNLMDELNKIIVGGDRKPSAMWKHYQEQYKNTKTYVEALKHGYRRAGVMMTKQVAGLAKMEAEIGGKARGWLWGALGREKPQYSKDIDAKLKEWSDMMLAGVNEYYQTHKEEAIQILPNLGYKDTLLQYVFEPKNLIQGIVESSPLMLEGILGTVFGGSAGGITTMAVPITGEVYAQAREEGTEPLPALAQSMLTGVGEATIEQWTLGRKLGLMKNFKKIVADGLPKILWEGTKTFFRGTAEEGSQEFNRNFWQWVFTDRSQQWMDNVKESMAAGGPMEMVMGGAFSAVGAAGGAVVKEQQAERLDKIAESVETEPTLSEEHKVEIRQEIDNVRKAVKQDEFEVAEETEKPPTEAIPAPQKPAEAITPAKAVEEKVKTPKIKAKEISPIVEPELTKQEEADIAQLEAEIEEPFVMERVKGVGFVIKERATDKEAAVVPKRKDAKAKLAELNEKGKEIKGTQRLPKLLTDKASIDQLVTEAKALKVSLKKVAQAARKAYSEGKKSGIEKVKGYYREIRLRERARKQLKQRIDKAVKTIKKDIPASVDFFYREAIESLRSGIDPSFRAKKTLRERERTKEFLTRKPEALKDMPVKLLKKLQKKSIGEYTIEEVEQVAGEIGRLTKQGKLKRKLELAQKERKLSKATQELTETISKGEKIDFESEPVTYETTKQGLIKTAFVKTKAWTWRPSRIFDMLDGVKNFAGKAHHIFVDQVNNAANAKLRAVDKRKDAGVAKMKELGIKPRDLAQIRTIDDIRYMVDEMIGIYCASKNRLGKLALMYGNNLNESRINNVIANLTDTERAWGDFIIKEYESRYDVLREAVIEVENRDMGYEENYTPIRRTEVDYSTHTEEILDAILQREHLRRTYTEHGFTIHRKDVPAEFQKPIRLNVTSMWAGQIEKQEQYIHFAELVRDMHKIAGDRDFRAAIEKQFGGEFNKIIKNYIDRVANPNIYKSYNSLENLSRRLRQNAVIAYLAYNLVTMAKQVPSLFLYLQDAGPTHLISSAMEFTRHPIETIKMVREKDPQVKHRSIERELEEMKNRNPERYNSILAKFGKAGMEGIYLFDSVARTIGWNAVYQKAQKSDMSETEAVRLAQNATLRTQPAAAAKDVAQLYATSEFANWFTMFTNQLNNIYNIATYDMTGYVKNAEYQKAALAFTGLSLTALFIWIITKRRLPESKEDWVDVASEQAINAVPLVGKAIMAGKREWGGTEIPAFELPKAAGRAINAIAEGKFDDGDIKAIAEGVAVTSGIPWIGPKRATKTIDAGEIKELIGGEPIEKQKKGTRKRIQRK